MNKCRTRKFRWEVWTRSGGSGGFTRNVSVLSCWSNFLMLRDWWIGDARLLSSTASAVIQSFLRPLSCESKLSDAYFKFSQLTDIFGCIRSFYDLPLLSFVVLGSAHAEDEKLNIWKTFSVKTRVMLKLVAVISRFHDTWCKSFLQACRD